MTQLATQAVAANQRGATLGSECQARAFVHRGDLPVGVGDGDAGCSSLVHDLSSGMLPSFGCCPRSRERRIDNG
jgi:hypothetical protein